MDYCQIDTQKVAVLSGNQITVWGFKEDRIENIIEIEGKEKMVMVCVKL